MKSKNTGKSNDSDDAGAHVGGILAGLGNILEKLDELTQSNTTFERSGKIPGSGEQIKGIYGFTFKTCVGEKSPHIESFGNINTDKSTGKTVVQEIREPAVDVFEDGDTLQIVAELPGIGVRDVTLEVKDDVLTISAEKGEKKYRKELLLPGVYPREKMKMKCNNGVLEINCSK